MPTQIPITVVDKLLRKKLTAKERKKLDLPYLCSVFRDVVCKWNEDNRNPLIVNVLIECETCTKKIFISVGLKDSFSVSWENVTDYINSAENRLRAASHIRADLQLALADLKSALYCAERPPEDLEIN